MSKHYTMKNLGIHILARRTIISAEINDSKDLVILETDKGKLFLTWEGDCCANCFLANVSGTEFLIGATIVSVEDTEWRDISRVQYKDVVECMGTTIRTNKGTVTFETRLHHNGYYGGHILVSDDEPMNQYHSPRDRKENTVKLTDF